MRFVVMGAGAIGSLVGGLLSSQHDVTLVGRGPHVEAINEGGLRLTGRTERTVKLAATTTTVNLAPADVLLLTVKAYDTRQAIEEAGDALGPETHVLSLQNGLGNLEILADRVDPSRVIGGTTTHGAIFHGPGHIEHTGAGRTVIGPPEPPDLPAHHELASALSDAGIATETVADIRPQLWAKAAVNAAINPLTAITGLPNGGLLDVPGLARLLEATAREVEAVARSTGVAVDDGDWVAQAQLVAEQTAGNRSSMLQDVQRGKRTEIDAICGRICEVAAEHGVPAPRNETLHALVKGIEATLHYDG